MRPRSSSMRMRSVVLPKLVLAVVVAIGRPNHRVDVLPIRSDMALRRIWGAARFSWWLTMLLHRFPDQSEFDRRAQEVELDYIASSSHALASVAEQYAGLPFED